MKIVTSATPEFLPGVQALRNSLKAQHPHAELWCYYYSKGMSHWPDGTEIVKPKGVNYIDEAEHYGTLMDNGRTFRHGLPLGPDMYARMLIPNHFEGRVFYVDADCLVLNDISELWDMDLKGMPSACCFRPDIGWHGGNRHDDMASGTFLCDTDKWRDFRKIGMTQYMYDTMTEVDQRRKDNRLPGSRSFTSERDRAKHGGDVFALNVESVMSYCHDGRFVHLPATYQNLTYYGCMVQYDKIAHYAGPKPWLIEQHDRRNKPVNYRELWLAFYENNIAQAKAEMSQLPGQRNDSQQMNEKARKVSHSNRGVLRERDMIEVENKFRQIYQKVQGQ